MSAPPVPIYGQLPPDPQVVAPPPYVPDTAITGNPLFTMLKRMVSIFLFWSVLMYIVGVLYNEIVISEFVRRMGGNEPMSVEIAQEEKALEEVGMTVKAKQVVSMAYSNDRLRYENHQLISFAVSFGLFMVIARMTLEAVCYYVSPSACALLSGHETTTLHQQQQQPQPLTNYAQHDPPSHNDQQQHYGGGDDGGGYDSDSGSGSASDEAPPENLQIPRHKSHHHRRHSSRRHH